jgi:hypothetical protein
MHPRVKCLRCKSSKFVEFNFTLVRDLHRERSIVFQRDGGRCAVTNYWSTNWEGAISPAGAYRVSTEVAHIIPFSRHNDVKFREACLFYAGIQPYKLTDE